MISYDTVYPMYLLCIFKGSALMDFACLYCKKPLYFLIYHLINNLQFVLIKVCGPCTAVQMKREYTD
jgi:hypothetical protein